MNAKEEFLNVTKTFKVICASIAGGDSYWDEEDPPKVFNLKKGYTPEEYNSFLKDIDFNYDSGYGGQELYGTIWCENGVWMDRGEYDGSEWWEIHVYPEIPKELLTIS